MRIAYLIIAHDHPRFVSRLVDRLAYAGVSFYIHIDRRADEAQFRRLLIGRRDVQFIDRRVAVNWMGFSVVEATLRLLERAVVDGFDYCVLLSGSDYPIKSNEHIAGVFQRTDKEHMSFWRLSDRPSWLHKVRYFYFIDAIPIRDWSLHREQSYWRRLFWGRFFKYQYVMPHRWPLAGLEYYGGSQWWSLSFGCARFILDYVAKNPRIKRFYRYTSSPDEMFFQTIVLNSEWARHVQNYDTYDCWRVSRREADASVETAMLPESSFNYRYIDWSGQASGDREVPAILDDRDWDRLVTSECLFARKLDEQKSSTLLDRIDREILGCAPSP